MTDSRFVVLGYDSREEWLELRGRGIGGSDVAAIMGLNEYKSPLQLWLEKTGRVQPKDLSDNESVEWGVTLEPILRDRFAANHPEYNVQQPSGIYQNSECPWEMASLDAEVYDKSSGAWGVLEIKTAGERRADDWKGGVPVYYQTQVTHYLNVTGYQFAWVAVLIGGQRYREFKFWPDDADRQAVRDSVRTFWGFVQRDEAPALVGHKDEGAALAALHADHSDELLQTIDGATNDAIAAYESVCAEIKRLEQEKRDRANELKALIGDNKGVSTDVYKVNWVRSLVSRYDLKALERDHPGLLDGYRYSRLTDMGLRVGEVG